jgi:hypothetical protein
LETAEHLKKTVNLIVTNHIGRPSQVFGTSSETVIVVIEQKKLAVHRPIVHFSLKKSEFSQVTVLLH